MRRFAAHNITMNCQIVSCPGINDGAALDRSLRELAEMFPAVNSISVVPVGVTKFREGLYPLRPYTGEEAAALIDQAGLKGYQVGGAAISTKHAGFAVNLGGATAADVKLLLQQVSDRVYENSGIRIEPEIRIW
jgi:UDP-N-acetylenolpyruvoylglucosamine reductase